MNIRGPCNDSTASIRHLKPGAGKPAQGGEAADGAKQTTQRTDSQAGGVAELAQQVRDIPEVREEVVRRVAQRLADGQYATRESAEGVARALMNET